MKLGEIESIRYEKMTVCKKKEKVRRKKWRWREKRPRSMFIVAFLNAVIFSSKESSTIFEPSAVLISLKSLESLFVLVSSSLEASYLKNDMVHYSQRDFPFPKLQWDH